jgi:hypothetical protein
MKTLHLHSWKRSSSHHHAGLGAKPFETQSQSLKEQIELASHLTGEPLARIVRRVQAGYPVALSLRADTEPDALVELLTEAGAVVTLSCAPESVASVAAS